MEKFLKSLNKYNPHYEEEIAFRNRMLNLLQVEGEKAFTRQLTTGHFTASAWVLSGDQKNALLLHHKKLNRWLQPGGHADGITDLKATALKEVQEETGLKQLKLLSHEIFDLDIHEIPQKEEVEKHLHYDVRYLFIASEKEAVKINEESNAYKWVALTSLLHQSKNESIIRMVEKSLNLH